MNRFILFMLLILSDLAISCTQANNTTKTQSKIEEVVKDDTGKRKVRAMWVIDDGKGYHPIDSVVRVIEVSSIIKAGDIIPYGAYGAKYRILD